MSPVAMAALLAFACGNDSTVGGATDTDTDTDTAGSAGSTGGPTETTSSMTTSSSGATDSTGTDGGSDTGVPPVGPPAQLIPLGVNFGGALNGADWSDSVESDSYRLDAVRFGAATQNVGGSVAGTMYRLDAWFPGVTSGPGAGIPITGQLTTGADQPVQAPDGMVLHITGYADAAAATTIFAENLDVVVTNGTFVGWLPPTAEAALAEHPEAWLGFEVDNDVLVPLIRIGSVPHAVAAAAFAAKGLHSVSGEPLPAAAYQTSVQVVAGTYHPGEQVSGLPAGDGWHCRHWAEPLGYPRATGDASSTRQVCYCYGDYYNFCGQPDCPSFAGQGWTGSNEMLVAAVGREAGVAPPPASRWTTLGQACKESPTDTCDPVVVAGRRILRFGFTCDNVPVPPGTCDPRPFTRRAITDPSTPEVHYWDETSDPGASLISVRVVSVCTQQGGDAP